MRACRLMAKASRRRFVGCARLALGVCFGKWRPGRPVAIAPAIAKLEEADVLMVMPLDRPARATRGLLNTLAAIAEKNAGFRSLGDVWADTTTPHGRLMLTVLGGPGRVERDLIRARAGGGRERAKARGVKLGRKPKLTEHQKRKAIRRRDGDGETVREIARSYNVNHSTISQLAT